MRRIVVVVVLALVATVAYAGGQPEGPQVGAGTEDISYISPDASPGVQDELTIPISVGEIAGNNVVVAYQLEVRNAENEVVWLESAVDESEAPGFFGSLLQNLGLQQRQTTVEIPETTSWDGGYQGSTVGRDGQRLVPDGEYTYVLTVSDSREVTATSEEKTVVVDNTPPEASATVNYDYLLARRRWTTRGTDHLTTGYERRGRMGRGRSRRRRRCGLRCELEPDEPTNVRTWNGRNLADTEVDDGEYTYTLECHRSSRATTARSTRSSLPWTPPTPCDRDLGCDTDRAFSPNGDGIQDTVSLSFGNPSVELLQSAVITVTDERGRAVGSVDIGDQIAGTVVLTGHVDEQRSRIAPDGTYLVSVTSRYENGTVASDGPIEVTVVDTVPPFGTVSASSSVFSPEGDGEKDTIRIFHDLSDASWTGYVYRAGRDVLQTLRLGRDVPPAVEWDGRGLDGQPIPDGTYSYDLIGTDDAGNSFQTEPIRVSIDRRPTNVELAVSREYFSPNGDGEGDVVVVRPELSIRSGIAEYTFRIMDEAGEEVLSGSGAGSLPSEISWDGRGSDGEVLPESEYVGVLDLVYEKGNRPQAVTPVVTIDNTIPQVALRASSTRITPNRDGEDETITFIPIVNPVGEIASYTGQIQSLDGRVVQEVTGTRPSGNVIWDGTDRSGRVARDGSYVASLVVEHRNGTTRRAQTGTISLAAVEYGGTPPVALRLSPQTFSPDGDGRADTVAVTLAVNDARPICRMDDDRARSEGNVFFEYTGEGEPVRSFEWDGRNDAGERVTMATDYEVAYEVTDAQARHCDRQRDAHRGYSHGRALRHAQDRPARCHLRGIPRAI